jgi:uncharacterized protein
MSPSSCLYVGTVSHVRAEPHREFSNRIVMSYIDLEELPRLLGGRLLRHTPGPLRFRRRDYHGDHSIPLETAVRDTVQSEIGHRPAGPIRLLTTLSSFGICFNPVSFYYCFEPDGETLDAVLVEVTNTPWGERQAYVTTGASGTFDKAMHVSPFMEMDHVYGARTSVPDQQLKVTVENRRAGQKLFGAALNLQRRELTPAQVRLAEVRSPMTPIRTLALIYAHALAIRLAGVRTVPHPGRQTG